MKTKKELIRLSNAISKAICAYHSAIVDNLKESGKEYKVQGDDDDIEGQRITTEGRHQDLLDMVIDKIRFNKDSGVNGVVEVHICEEDYEDKDYWLSINYIDSDCVDYIYDYINWEV